MIIQWYPGHIAKAEKALKSQLQLVDVILEVLDARIPVSTRHPQIHQWVGHKAKILVMNRVDMISEVAQQRWLDWFQTQGELPYCTDAQHGKGIEEIVRAVQAAGEAMNQRRRDRGMLARPVRAVVIGFPNVGKSALINRLLKRRVVSSARRPGVTRQLRWVRISDAIELLDAPGILPVKLHDQAAAIKLAICDDIGEAAYNNQSVAAALVSLLKDHQADKVLNDRYRLDPKPHSGETYLELLADHQDQGDRERTACRLLNDFRKGLLGNLCLEMPPG